MRISCIGYFHGSGGAERQIILLANELSSRGHEVHLISLVRNNIVFDLSEDVIVHDLTHAESIKGNRIINRYRVLKNKLEEINPDININYWFQSAYLTTFMPKKSTGKVIYSERGDPGDDEYSGLLGLIRSVTFKFIDGFVFQSEGAKNYFNYDVQRKSEVISNPVIIPKDKYSEPSGNRVKKIVTVGRLHPQKNQKLLIKSFSKIADVFPEYTLEIYGEGEIKADLENLINISNLKSKVYLMGTRKNIFDAIYNSTLFVLTSDYEGLPNALLEAMALGIPCISTDCKPGGAREIIHNNVDGIVIPRNNETILSNAIDYMLKNQEIREDMARKAMHNMNRYKPETIYNNWEKFLSEVTNK